MAGNRVIGTEGQHDPGRHSRDDLSWLLDDLVDRVDEVDKAVILSRDGIPIGASRALTAEDAERLSAMAAGIQSLARGAGRYFGGGSARRTIVEMDTSYLLVTAATGGACLAVLSPSGADLGMVAYETAAFVERATPYMAVRFRDVPTYGRE